MRCAKFSRIFFVLPGLLLLLTPAFGQAAADRPLTNSDIVKMVRAGLPESVIVREIQTSEPNFNATPDGLISLKHQHVPDGVLGAIVESQAGVRTWPAAPPGVVYAAGPSSSPHSRKLPNVDAAFRIDSKTTGQVQIRANQIKVEKAGVPLFSVKWKVNTSK